MKLVVVDASSMVQALIDPAHATALDASIGSARLIAPDVINQEVASALRRHVKAGELTASEGEHCIDRFARAPIRRLTTRLLLRAVWDLRDNFSAYDAAYVALAAQLRCPLVTHDGRLASAPRGGISILLV